MCEFEKLQKKPTVQKNKESFSGLEEVLVSSFSSQI